MEGRDHETAVIAITVPMEKLVGNLEDSKGNVVDPATLHGKVVAFYFSAHWCPPCRAFTPLLIEVYKTLKSQGKKFEVVFLSSDQNKEAFDKYYGEMPWLALEYGSKLKDAISQKYGIRGIPTLIVCNKDGTVRSANARMLIHQYKEAAFPFDEATVKALENV